MGLAHPPQPLATGTRDEAPGLDEASRVVIGEIGATSSALLPLEVLSGVSTLGGIASKLSSGMSSPMMSSLSMPSLKGTLNAGQILRTGKEKPNTPNIALGNSDHSSRVLTDKL